MSAKPTKNQIERKERLMPNGIPRWIRCYDCEESGDRYTVCYTGKAATIKGQPKHFPYVGMSDYPKSFCQHGEHGGQPIDTIKKGRLGVAFPPAIGRRCHLGKRIRFKDLPADCQNVVLKDYQEIWGIEF